jgi:hypothetical protein
MIISLAAAIKAWKVSLEIVRQPGRRDLLLRLTTAGFYAEPQSDGTFRIAIPGFVAAEGDAALPVKRVWVEIPDATQARLIATRAREVLAFAGLQPFLKASSARGRSRRPTPAAFAAGESARILETITEGGVTKVLVELAPLRWGVQQNELALARELYVRLRVK